MTMAAKWMHEDARAQRARRTLPRPKRYVLQASPRTALVADDKLAIDQVDEPVSTEIVRGS
jgi:hypothetical protein